MTSIGNALNQYSKLGINRLEAGRPQRAGSFSGACVDRAISLLSEFNNAVFIVDDQKQGDNGLVIEVVDKLFEEALQLDAKLFVEASGDQARARLEEIFAVLADEKKTLLVITFLEWFAKDERLAKLLQSIVKKSSVPVLGVTSISGFRQLEQKPDLAGCLQFILTEKMPRMDKRNKSVLIIGATSFFGNAVYDLFSREYKFVRGTGFSKAGPLGFDKLDVTSEEEIKNYFSKYPGFDIVIYVAGEADADAAEKERDRAQALNVEAVSIISRYAKDCKFVYISSEYVFDGSSGPYGSHSPVRPINYYGLTKLEGEKAALKNFSNALVVRLGALYGYNGPSDKKTSVTKLIAGLENPGPLEADNVQIKHPILLEDAAGTLLKLLDHGANGIYQANGPEGLNKQEMAERIAAVRAEATGRAFSYPIVGIAQAGTAGKPLNTHMVNVDTPRPFNEGIRFLFQKQGLTKGNTL